MLSHIKDPGARLGPAPPPVQESPKGEARQDDLETVAAAQA